jgi:hypothetical protein
MVSLQIAFDIASDGSDCLQSGMENVNCRNSSDDCFWWNAEVVAWHATESSCPCIDMPTTVTAIRDCVRLYNTGLSQGIHLSAILRKPVNEPQMRIEPISFAQNRAAKASQVPMNTLPSLGNRLRVLAVLLVFL